MGLIFQRERCKLLIAIYIAELWFLIKLKEIDSKLLKNLNCLSINGQIAANEDNTLYTANF